MHADQIMLSQPQAPEESRTPAAWFSRGTLIEVFALTALAAVLRLTTLGLQSYEVDEASTVYVIHRSFVHMLHAVAWNEATPPIYYVVAWAWARAFGTGEAALRLLSALAGVAIVPFIYAAGRTLSSRRVGLVAAAIVATNPYLVFYSQEARAYAFFVLLSTVAFLCCVRAIQTPSTRAFALWAAVSVAAIATHYFALFAWVGQVVALAFFGAPRRLGAWSSAAVALLSLPLVLLARHQAGAGHVTWIATSNLFQRVRVTAETFALGATFKGTLRHSVLAAFGLLAIVVATAIAAAGFLLVRRATPSERRAALIAGLVATVTIVVPLLGVIVHKDYFLHKNVIPAVPLLALVLAAGLGCKRAGRTGTASAIGLVSAGIALTLMSFAISSLRRTDVRQISQQLGAPARDRILIFVPRWRQLLEHYQGTT